MMAKVVPVVGTPITWQDLRHLFSKMTRATDPVNCFEKEFAHYIGARFAVSMQSGRSVLYWLLKYMASRSERREVVIPAYTHQSVLYAVAAAGLTPVLCDTCPESFHMDLKRLESLTTEQTLCILPTYLFGFPLDIEVVCRIARARGCFVIEDVTQACGAAWRGFKMGRFGDAAIFSFKKGKPFTTVTGGMLVTSRADIISQAKSELKMWTANNRWEDLNTLLKVFVFALAIRPFVFGILLRLRLKTVDTNGAVDLPLCRMSRIQAALGSVMLQKLDRMNEIRVSNASLLNQSLFGSDQYVLPGATEGSKPVFLRYPLLVKNPALRQGLVERLLRKGILASATDYVPVNEINEPTLIARIRNGSEIFWNARRTKDSILTLPTHPLVTREDLHRVITILRNPENNWKLPL